eukprot:7163742-Prorocentrum_lima.AAC.1
MTIEDRRWSVGCLFVSYMRGRTLVAQAMVQQDRLQRQGMNHEGRYLRVSCGGACGMDQE